MQHKKTVISREKGYAVFSSCFYGSLKNEHALKKSKNITLKLTNKSILLGPLEKKQKRNATKILPIYLPLFLVRDYKMPCTYYSFCILIIMLSDYYIIFNNQKHNLVLFSQLH